MAQLLILQLPNERRDREVVRRTSQKRRLSSDRPDLDLVCTRVVNEYRKTMDRRSQRVR